MTRDVWIGYDIRMSSSKHSIFAIEGYIFFFFLMFLTRRMCEGKIRYKSNSFTLAGG